MALVQQGKEVAYEKNQGCTSTLPMLQVSVLASPPPPALPAQAQRWQQQDHEDEEGVTLVHGCPVLSRPEGREEAVGFSLSARWPQDWYPHHLLIIKCFPVSNPNPTLSTTGTRIRPLSLQCLRSVCLSSSLSSSLLVS